MKCPKSTETEGLRATALEYTKAMVLGAKIWGRRFLFFPATKTAVAVLVASAIKTNLWFFYLFFGVVMNASRPAVSWLKFETFCTASHLY